MKEEPGVREWTVAAGEDRTRLDLYLTVQGAMGTRSQIRKLIDDGRVWLDDGPVKSGTLVRAGQRIRVECRAAEPTVTGAEPIALDILYEDDWIAAINKPAGLVVHPAPGHRGGTVVNALLHRWGKEGAGFDPVRLGLVHRIDKDTSGLLLVARDLASLENLSRQFRERQVEKLYLALVRGVPRVTAGTVAAPIGRDRAFRKRMTVCSGGREAVTRYRVMEVFAGASLVEARPETGRTHQIRVHLASLGHPILSDSHYGRPGGAERALIPRQALHAAAATFRHPDSGRVMTITAPLPRDFLDALEHLRRLETRKTAARG
jgi:23S rRNA pseudouridine1911/1915/1917 synthase